MNVAEQIKGYIASQPDSKRIDMQDVHDLILRIAPACELWFFDGRNSESKTVSNPNIGYGRRTMKYADGRTSDFYRVGLSGNKTGISVYVLGFADKTHLARTYGGAIGKASVTGYCIKFKSLKDVHIEILEAAIRDGLEAG